MKCTCGRTFEKDTALIKHITEDHMDEATYDFVTEWVRKEKTTR